MISEQILRHKICYVGSLLHSSILINILSGSQQLEWIYTHTHTHTLPTDWRAWPKYFMTKLTQKQLSEAKIITNVVFSQWVWGSRTINQLQSTELLAHRFQLQMANKHENLLLTDHIHIHIFATHFNRAINLIKLCILYLESEKEREWEEVEQRFVPIK